jgi:general secretion pathway protein K
VGRRSPDQRRSRGVALVAVLLLIAGLIAMATAMATLSVSQRRAAQRAHEADTRRELLDGALRVALAEIAHGKPEGPFWHPRTPRAVKVGGKTVEVILEREGGRIDLNTSEPKFLIAAFVALGRSEKDARASAARVRDWVDTDDDPSPDGGAERAEYQAAKLHFEPRNGPFEVVEELRQVLGLHDLSDAQLDAFTVYSQQLEPASTEAPQAVRDALAWLAKSAGEGGSNAASDAPPPPNPAQPVSYAGAVVRLRACMKDQTEAPCRVTIQRVTGNNRNPFQVLLWR